MDEYFASLETDRIGSELRKKVKDYYNYINTTGMLENWRDLHLYYYHGFYSKGNVLKAGKHNEKREVNFNHFRNLLEHIKILVTSQRPAFEPMAVNSDHESYAQTILARGLLDYYMKQEGLEEVMDTSLDYGLEAGEGWVFQEFDEGKGKVIGQTEPELDDTGEVETEAQTKHEGEIKSYSYHPVNVVRDWTLENTEDNLWYIVVRYVNKFELAAKYPEFKDKIISQKSSKSNEYDRFLYKIRDDRINEETDLIPFCIFRHEKSAVLPEGRQVEFLDDDTVIFDGDLPYDDLGIYRIMPGKRKGSNFGYSVSFDLLPMQKVVDMLDSTITTNQNAFGVQIVAAQKGSGVSSDELSEGLTLLLYNGQEAPQPLRLLATPPEIFNYKQQVVQDMETIAGINSVTRGNPEASLKSGAALALVQSLTIQFNSGVQNSFANLMEDVGTGTLKILQKYAQSKRTAMIAGKSKIPLLKEFSGEDLNKIDRVIVNAGNPMSKTLSGRLAVADTLLERGLIKNPEQYIMMIETGRLDPVIESQSAELMLIKDENERMFKGEQVPVIATDNHTLHLREHGNDLRSVEARKNVQMVEIVTAHMYEHINQLRTVDPELLMLLGQQPLSQGIPPVPQPEPNSPNQGSVGGAQEVMSPEAGGMEPARMPTMPNNPMTGENFNTQTGGL